MEKGGGWEEGGDSEETWPPVELGVLILASGFIIEAWCI